MVVIKKVVMYEKSFKQTKMIFQISKKKEHKIEVKNKIQNIMIKSFTYICINFFFTQTSIFVLRFIISKNESRLTYATGSNFKNCHNI